MCQHIVILKNISFLFGSCFNFTFHISDFCIVYLDMNPPTHPLQLIIREFNSVRRFASFQLVHHSCTSNNQTYSSSLNYFNIVVHMHLSKTQIIINLVDKSQIRLNLAHSNWISLKNMSIIQYALSQV